LSQGENPVIDGVDDRSEFLSTQDAFRLLGFSDKEQKNIFRILAGILQLGNIVIDPGKDQQLSKVSVFKAHITQAIFAHNIAIKILKAISIINNFET